MEFQPINDEVEDYYQISYDGKVKNMKNNHIYQEANRNGYRIVKLKCKDGKIRDKSVARLLGLTYLTLPDDFNQISYVINHKNGDKHDNRVQNIEWITQKSNIHHAYQNNLIAINNKPVIQYDKNNSKINEFESIQAAVIKTGCDRSSIIKVCKGYQKYSLGFIWKYKHQEKKEDIHDNMKLIDNYNNYMISQSGSVWSCKTKKILKPCLNANNHAYVTLSNKEGKRNFYIHNLVAEYFLGLKDQRMVIHINGDKKDNRLNNLKITDVIQSHKKLSSTN